MLDMYIVTWVC